MARLAHGVYAKRMPRSHETLGRFGLCVVLLDLKLGTAKHNPYLEVQGTCHPNDKL